MPHFWRIAREPQDPLKHRPGGGGGPWFNPDVTIDLVQVLLACPSPIENALVERLLHRLDVTVAVAPTPSEACARAADSRVRRVWLGTEAGAVLERQLRAARFTGQVERLPERLDLDSVGALLARPAEWAALEEATLVDLREQLGGGAEVRELAELYLDSLDSRWTAVTDAWQAGDLDACRRAAHTLKSSSALLGLRALGEMCALIESAASDGDPMTGALVDVGDGLRSPTRRSLQEWLGAG